MIINTKRLQLRPIDKCDINAYFNISQDDDIIKYASNMYVNSKEEAKRKIMFYKENSKRADNYFFAIEEKESKELIGMICAEKFIEHTLCVSLFVTKSCRDRGYAKEALNAMIYKLVQLSRSYTLEFFVDDTNCAAFGMAKTIKMEAEKLGYKFKTKKIDLNGIEYQLKL